ncbi:Uncharacterized protein BM_BM8263 [Brugia malayi]|uniref:Uncharacterized protein n=1 Tax=Brugia malayi TaxID=6279 RepID=A0A4E9F9G2_BRUMA|nr:Uncharacterized protein BM_BM8263 [Brugia malayi]VIO90520.1 Uncharacterized protein BM_BM8263 [Brugia malayi]
MKNANFGINAPNGLIIPEKINNEKIKGDEITQQNTFTTATTDNELQDDNVTDTTETAINYYDSDFEVKKIPEMEENGEEIATETDRNNNENLMEKKTFKNKFNDPFWKHFLQINETENTTQNSLDDLKEVVNTLNLSQAQTATFVKIIEKIVDDELKRRHNEELSKSKFTQTSVKPKLAAAKFHEIDSETAKDIDDRHDQEIRPHEKLTVNTRLSFNDQHIIDDYRNGQDEIPETLAAESLKSDSRKEARKKTDYMVREQAEYDRLISGITDATPESGSDYLETKNGQAFNRGLIRTTVKSTNTEEPQTTSSTGLQYEKTGLQPVEESYIPKRTMTVYGKVTTIPRTVFERQAEDFRSRLLGMNGFGDIIKALKHGKIGFFERN